MGGSFVLTEEEATLGVMELRGDALWIRPTPRARAMVWWAGLMVIMALAVMAVAGLRSGSGKVFVVLFFSPVLVLAIATAVQIPRAAVILEPDRVRVRNLWTVRRIRGIDLNHLWIESKRGPLWSWGPDARGLPPWKPVQLVVLARGAGQRIVADALRSDTAVEGRLPTQPTIAELRVGVIERWRATHWVATRPLPPT